VIAVVIPLVTHAPAMHHRSGAVAVRCPVVPHVPEVGVHVPKGPAGPVPQAVRFGAAGAVHDPGLMFLRLTHVPSSHVQVSIVTSHVPAPPQGPVATHIDMDVDPSGQSASERHSHVSPASSQSKPPSQGDPSWPVHAPATHESSPLQNTPSSHAPPPSVRTHAPASSSQRSTVQVSPSLHAGGTQAPPQHSSPSRHSLMRTQSPVSHAALSHGPAMQVVASHVPY
jgi:hypothetical protein